MPQHIYLAPRHHSNVNDVHVLHAGVITPAAIQPQSQENKHTQSTSTQAKTSIRTHVINVFIVAHPQATAPLHSLLVIETAPSPFCGMRPHLPAPTTWNEAEWQWV
jgi:hypothetical protein